MRSSRLTNANITRFSVEPEVEIVSITDERLKVLGGITFVAHLFGHSITGYSDTELISGSNPELSVGLLKG